MTELAVPPRRGRPRVRDHAGGAGRRRRGRRRRYRRRRGGEQAVRPPARPRGARRGRRRAGARADRDRVPVRHRRARRPPPRCSAAWRPRCATLTASRSTASTSTSSRWCGDAASRRQARRVALVLLYQHDVTGHDLASSTPPTRPTRARRCRRTRGAGRGRASDPARLDLLIAEHATGWTVDRIARDRARGAAHRRAGAGREARHPGVGRDRRGGAAHQAVRLAGGGVFVNGVLGGVARALGVGR